MISRNYSRLKKVKALAERGVAGERTAAAAILKRLHPGYRCTYGPCSTCTLPGCNDRVCPPNLTDMLIEQSIRNGGTHELTAIQRHIQALG